MSVGNFLAKGAGALGLGIVLYDAHTIGKVEAASNQKRAAANLVTKPVMGMLSQNSPSIVEARAKKTYANYMLDEDTSGIFTGFSGYMKGLTKVMVSDVVPLGLSIGALATKGWISKGFGLGLLAFGGIFVLRDVMGVWKHSELG